MAAIRQYYEDAGVPLVVDADPADAVTAWRTQRARLRSWLGALPDDEWDGPTRCAGWDTATVVRHLVSATQFLGYTLLEASDGTATTLLRGMDTRTTVASAAELLGDRDPGEWRELLAGTDDSVETALGRLADLDRCPRGLGTVAEAPPGHLAAHLALSHFLFDSWVHEYDLHVPRGEVPTIDPLETRVVVGYLVGLALVASDDAGAPAALDLRLTDPELRIGAEVADGIAVIRPDRPPVRAAVVEGGAVDVVDRMTGRAGGPVSGDDAGLAVLDRFALVLAT